MDTDEIVNLEARYVVQTYRRPPFVIERGDGVYLYDLEGRRYLDFVSGIAVNALGYGDEDILDTLNRQARTLIHVSNLYHTIPHVQLAKALIQSSFADQVFYCNSGAEAVETALKFARKWARIEFDDDKYEVVAFSHSFHGRTMGALSATSKEAYRRPFEPLVPGFRFAEFNDLSSAEAAMNDHTCAVIVEPVQGEGGVYPAEEDFLQGLRALCDRHQALLIFDEVQCGMGRTGTLWAHEAYGVTPDIMTLAKPLGGGFPIGATLVTQRVANAIQPGDHGSTFAANSVICAIAQVVLERVSDEAFLANVRARGAYLEDRLRDLMEKHPGIIETRGRGLMWGLELAGEAAPVVHRAHERGLLVCVAGPNVLRLLPPLIIENEHIDFAIQCLDEALTEVEELQ